MEPAHARRPRAEEEAPFDVPALHAVPDDAESSRRGGDRSRRGSSKAPERRPRSRRATGRVPHDAFLELAETSPAYRSYLSSDDSGPQWGPKPQPARRPADARAGADDDPFASSGFGTTSTALDDLPDDHLAPASDPGWDEPAATSLELERGREEASTADEDDFLALRGTAERPRHGGLDAQAVAATSVVVDRLSPGRRREPSDPSPRRTVRIGGIRDSVLGERRLPASPRRANPDRLALWAVILALMLALVAAASARGDADQSTAEPALDAAPPAVETRP